jgi:hypothetical protein
MVKGGAESARCWGLLRPQPGVTNAHRPRVSERFSRGVRRGSRPNARLTTPSSHFRSPVLYDKNFPIS